ncbi:MAG: hypothetical protein J7K62_02070, partial [Thermoplasmata archaeon]|nr:hypothetical protein [Thermoplasmata archaeon]
MYTLEKAMIEYFKLSRPDFSESNRDILPIFVASAVSLTSKVHIKRYVPIPSTFYVALIGEPRTGKTAFYKAYFRLFRGTGIGEIPLGSPEAMLKGIESTRHGYIWYDEVSHLAKLIDSYMGTLLPLLNKMYYLDGLSQTRTDNRRSVIVDPESYFVHVYFGGTPTDWSMLEKKAVGGFVRRTLVVYTKGMIPFFSETSLSIEEEKRRAKLYNLTNAVLKALNKIEIMVRLKGLSLLAEKLEREQLDNEKKSMIEEYMYKILAGRLIANLITFDINEDPHTIESNIVLERIKENAKKHGVGFEVWNATSTHAEIYLEYKVNSVEETSEDRDPKITDYLPPNFSIMTYEQLVRSVKPQLSAPDQIIMKNIERVKQWLNSGGNVVISKRTFVQQILHTANPQFYKPVLEILQDAGYIRIVDYVYKGRQAQYVVLDPKARICGNCAHYRDPKECPLIKDVFDF